jgi:hypothetical protein
VEHWAAQTQEQRNAIMADKASREEFVVGVRQRLCRYGRGDVYQQGLDEHTRALLPSLFGVLKSALEKLGKGGEGVEAFEHNFEEHTLEWKVRWEMEAGEWSDTLVCQGPSAASLE